MTKTSPVDSDPGNPPAAIECCVQCGEPKNRPHSEAGDEVANGWPYCVNPSCVAFQEPVANAWYRRISPPKEEDSELHELLENLIRAYQESDKAFVASGSSLLSYVRGLREERDGWRDIADSNLAAYKSLLPSERVDLTSPRLIELEGTSEVGVGFETMEPPTTGDPK